jgi:hypothetical protein
MRPSQRGYRLPCVLSGIRRNDEAVRPALVDELEEFIRAGSLWDHVALEQLIARLEDESGATDDPVPQMLAHAMRAILLRLGMGGISQRMTNDLEGIVYPRIWKVMEAARDGLPDGELRTRIEVLNRRLSRRLVEENPG